MIVGFRFAGIGGQGLVMQANILAQALGVFEGLNVVETTSYSAAVRGGLTWADVIATDGEIYDITCEHPDFMVLTAKKGFDANAHLLADTRYVVIDTHNVPITPGDLRSYGLEPSRYYIEDFYSIGHELGVSTRSVNMLILGVIAHASRMVSKSALLDAMKLTLTRNIEENMKALEYGYNLLDNLNEGKSF